MPGSVGSWPSVHVLKCHSTRTGGTSRKQARKAAKQGKSPLGRILLANQDSYVFVAGRRSGHAAKDFSNQTRQPGPSRYRRIGLPERARPIFSQFITSGFIRVGFLAKQSKPLIPRALLSWYVALTKRRVFGSASSIIYLLLRTRPASELAGLGNWRTIRRHTSSSTLPISTRARHSPAHIPTAPKFSLKQR
jgi:hypothetical protein